MSLGGRASCMALVILAGCGATRPPQVSAGATPAAQRSVFPCRVHETFGPLGAHRDDILASDGRILQVFYGGAHTRGHEWFSYDERGHLLRHDWALEQDEVRQPHGELVAEGTKLTKTIAYAYDAQGRKVRAESTSETHGAWGDRTSRRSELHRYDTAGRRIALEVRDSTEGDIVWRFFYDGERRMESRRETMDGMRVGGHRYTYDRAGRRIGEEVLGVSVERYLYEYDGSGLLTNKILEGQPKPSQRLEYDANRRVVRWITGPRTIQYHYDSHGYIERIEHSDQPSQTFEYSAGCTPALVDALFPSPIDAILDDPRTL
ncbi:hypothetical protein [Pendulispora albinea]|uniref:RHS repeat protein n=1 Tax=Pendulispora albinea TaxID=2741071 RepID=A0ABZ2M7I8_9BACT